MSYKKYKMSYKIFCIFILCSIIFGQHHWETAIFASDDSDMRWFEKLLTFLVSGALVFSLIKGYLTVNKIWKRRKNEEVANSISIVAAMLGFVVGFPFLLNALIITQDYFTTHYLTLQYNDDANCIYILTNLLQDSIQQTFWHYLAL